MPRAWTFGNRGESQNSLFWHRENKQTLTDTGKGLQHSCLQRSSINNLQSAGIRTRKGVLRVKIWVSNLSWEAVDLASPFPRSSQSLKTDVSVRGHADLAKGAAWARHSPKARGGCCDPARFGAAVRGCGERPGWCPPGPCPEGRGRTLGQRSEGASDLGMALRRAR